MHVYLYVNCCFRNETKRFRNLVSLTKKARSKQKCKGSVKVGVIELGLCLGLWCIHTHDALEWDGLRW